MRAAVFLDYQQISALDVVQGFWPVVLSNPIFIGFKTNTSLSSHLYISSKYSNIPILFFRFLT